MKIVLIPQYRQDELRVSRAGDVLTINDEPFDFGPLPAGATLPADAIDCQWIVGPVERDDEGVLRLSLLLPIQKSVFYDELPDIDDPADGDIELPVIRDEGAPDLADVMEGLADILAAGAAKPAEEARSLGITLPGNATPEQIAAAGKVLLEHQKGASREPIV